MVGSRESPKPAIYDAVSYLAAVSEALHDEPAKYHEFIKLFTDFQTNRVDISNCIASLGPLFEDHPNLLRGFKVFLPDGAEEHIHLVNFLREVKKEFHDEPAKFGEFVKIMEDYRTERIDLASANARVVEIIKDHQKLFRSYNALFPVPVHSSDNRSSQGLATDLAA